VGSRAVGYGLDYWGFVEAARFSETSVSYHDVTTLKTSTSIFTAVKT